jgi:hypothetical protein
MYENENVVGYTREQIELMESDEEYQRMLAMDAMLEDDENLILTINI